MLHITHRFGMMLIALSIVAFSAFASGGAERSAAAVTTLDLALTGAEENPPVTNSTGTAFARLTFDDQTNVLTYALTVSGLSPELVTAAHIHRGPVGVNGPVIHNLSLVGFTQVSGSINLPAGDVADLRAGNLYVNVHSVQHPGGFARAQIYLDPATGIRTSAAAIQDSFNRGDITRFLRYFTDAGVMSTFDATREEAAGFLQAEAAETKITLNVGSIVVSGSSATSIDELVFNGLQLDRVFHRWVLDGVWKVDQEEDLPELLPAGASVIEMRLQEYAFVYDRSLITSGNIAFHAVNAGRQEHEAVIFKMDGNVQLQALFALDEEDPLPPGFTFVGANFAEPGGDFNIAFAAPLPAGRYGIVCFVPDAGDGIPHAIKGMTSEFTVGGGAGGSAIRPPNTGDGGLVESASTYRPALLVIGLLSLTLGGGMLAFGRRSA